MKHVTIVVTASMLVRRARAKYEDLDNEFSCGDASSALDEVVSEIRRDIETLRDAVEEEMREFMWEDGMDWDGFIEDVEDDDT